jgi:hypothetical protein
MFWSGDLVMFVHRSLTACAFGELSVLANFRPTSISTNSTDERCVFVVRLYGIVLSLHMLMCSVAGISCSKLSRGSLMSSVHIHDRDFSGACCCTSMRGHRLGRPHGCACPFGRMCVPQFPASHNRSSM